ncbi:hypothetical protein CTI12_AA444620 [Artemisia annua]|uniref:Uncharacterized protein n=1 Tax=Artemisia annua TaxID=35608 RepID=A0A2U1LWV1_ARTAN|nr:hypothetical protein CTI12_AA444620 [Artemisia annua]
MVEKNNFLIHVFLLLLCLVAHGIEVATTFEQIKSVMPGRKGMGTEDVMIHGHNANREEHHEFDENKIGGQSAKGDGHKGFDEKGDGDAEL